MSVLTAFNISDANDISSKVSTTRGNHSVLTMTGMGQIMIIVFSKTGVSKVNMVVFA